MQINILLARAYFLFGLTVYMVGGEYIDTLSLPPHHDAILELIPVVDASAVAAYGLIFLYAAAVVCLKPMFGSEKEIEFWTIIASMLVLRTIMCVAAGFGPPAGYFVGSYKAVDIEFWLRELGLLFRYDFFFSGHTAVPFLFFLFFEGRTAKTIFLTGTLVMAVSVLLLHHHYVIDVVSAPIIVWAIYSFHKFPVFKEEEVRK